MKVNDLKALFEKSGTIKAQPPSNISKNVTLPVHKVQVLPEDKIPKNIQNSSKVQQEESNGGIAKNNDFLNELNNKLRQKSVKTQDREENIEFREKVIQNNVKKEQPYFSTRKMSEQIKKEFSKQSQQIKKKPLEPPISKDQKKVVKEQNKDAELNFEDILGKAEMKQMMKSSIKARYGIDERHPTTRQQQVLFSELDQQRKSNIEAERLSKQNSAPTYITRNPKPNLNNTIIRDQKIKRIDNIIGVIFSKKCRQTILGRQDHKQITSELKSKGKSVQKMSTENKKSQVAITQSNEIQQVLNKIPNEQSSEANQRGKFAMSREMLNQMSVKIKKRSDKLQLPQPKQQIKEQKSVERAKSKRKQKFQSFDDAL